MFEFVANWINARKEKVCRRNCVCDTYFARANDLCEAQEKLFRDVRTVVDMEQAETWEKDTAELIVELNAEKHGIWLAKNYR